MVEADGAPHVSKAMPVNVDPAAMAGFAAAETECAAVLALPLGVVATDGEPFGAGVEGADDCVAEARTLSTAELSLPHVASSATDEATNWAFVSWPIGSTPTRAANAPTFALRGVIASAPAAVTLLSQM